MTENEKVCRRDKVGEIKGHFAPIDGVVLYSTKFLAIRKGDSLMAIA